MRSRIWLHEGLAAQFEVIRGGRWAGISRAHDLRLPDWRRLQIPLRLERLVRDAGFGRGYQARPLCPGLGTGLFPSHPAPAAVPDLHRPACEVRTLADSPPSEPRATAFSTPFKRAFGTDLDGLERDWHQFMKTVQTPLEQHAPATESHAQNRAVQSRRGKN